MAYAARADSPNGSGMVILPDVRGLHAFYRELTIRFAEAGFDSVAIDYFGRTAKDDKRDDTLDWKPLIEQTTPENVATDVKAAIDYLATPDGGRPRSLFTVGFCWGGSASWRQSAEGHGLAGCIGFYGGRPMERVGRWIPKMSSPLLMLLAGEDSTSPEEFERFANEVRAQGVEVESHTYDGAPHSFFDRKQSEYKNASDDAWRQILDFTARLAKQSEPA